MTTHENKHITNCFLSDKSKIALQQIIEANLIYDGKQQSDSSFIIPDDGSKYILDHNDSFLQSLQSTVPRHNAPGRTSKRKMRNKKNIGNDYLSACCLSVDDTTKSTLHFNPSGTGQIPVAAMQSDEHLRIDIVHSVANVYDTTIVSASTGNIRDTEQYGSFDMVRIGMSLMNQSFCKKYIIFKLNHRSNSESIYD